VFKTGGDVFCATLDDADDALAAALDGQVALAAENGSTFGPDLADLRVRMGIHHGKADARGGGLRQRARVDGDDPRADLCIGTSAPPRDPGTLNIRT